MASVTVYMVDMVSLRDLAVVIEPNFPVKSPALALIILSAKVEGLSVKLLNRVADYFHLHRF